MQFFSLSMSRLCELEWTAKSDSLHHQDPCLLLLMKSRFAEWMFCSCEWCSMTFWHWLCDLPGYLWEIPIIFHCISTSFLFAVVCLFCWEVLSLCRVHCCAYRYFLQSSSQSVLFFIYFLNCISSLAMMVFSFVKS